MLLYIFTSKLSSDFKIVNHQDRFEVHEELTGGKLRFLQRDRTRLLDKVKQIVCRDSQSPLNMLDSMAATLIDHGEGFQFEGKRFY